MQVWEANTAQDSGLPHGSEYVNDLAGTQLN